MLLIGNVRGPGRHLRPGTVHRLIPIGLAVAEKDCTRKEKMCSSEAMGGASNGPDATRSCDRENKPVFVPENIARLRRFPTCITECNPPFSSACLPHAKCG